MLYYIIGILIIIIIFLIYFLSFQRHKYLKELLDNNNELMRMNNKCIFYLKEIITLKKTIKDYEEKKYKKNNGFDQHS